MKNILNIIEIPLRHDKISLQKMVIYLYTWIQSNCFLDLSAHAFSTGVV